MIALAYNSHKMITISFSKKQMLKYIKLLKLVGEGKKHLIPCSLQIRWMNFTAYSVSMVGK